jgi:hypothetical protein
MNVDEFAVAGIAEYVNPPTFQGTPGCTEFEDLCGEGEFSFVDCSIDSVTVLDPTAGLGRLIQFHGTGFGDTIDAEMRIPDAERARLRGMHEVSFDSHSYLFDTWSDTFISLDISSNPFNVTEPSQNPAPFGSGDWEIHPMGRRGMRCMETVDIHYSLKNFYNNFLGGNKSQNYSPSLLDSGNRVAKPIKVKISNELVPQLQVGGPTPSTDVVEIVKSVVCQWESSTGVDFEVLFANPQDTAIGGDGIFIFGVGNLADVSATTRANLRINGSCTNSIPGWTDEGSFIRIDTTKNWYFGESDNSISALEWDFYSILLHEFGHAIGFDHSMDPANNLPENDRSIMYEHLNAGTTKRQLDIFHIQGSSSYANLLNLVNDECFEAKDVGLFFAVNCDSTSSTVNHFYGSDQIMPTFLSMNELNVFLNQKVQKYFTVDQLGRRQELRTSLIENRNAVKGVLHILDSQGVVVAKFIRQ